MVFELPKDKVFIVAEIGINHNGDMEIAKDTIQAAFHAGADAVKFQNYKTEDFINDKSLFLEYEQNGKQIRESQFEIFKRCELNRENMFFLKKICDDIGINFHSTPTSKQGINDILDVGGEILKNGSDYLTDHRLIRLMGETGKFTVLSTGMATLAEIEFAVNTYMKTGNSHLMLLHCTSSYPTPPEDVNLARIKTLKSTFGLPVGFSDHSEGVYASVGATILGAKWIEKHFTLDKNLSGPDHRFSLDKNELSQLVNAVREIEKMIGDPKILPTVSEQFGREAFRLSCVAQVDIEPGKVISKNDISFERPGTGIAPRNEDLIVGLKAKRFISKGSLLSMEQFNKD